jgi:hypothetical protein
MANPTPPDDQFIDEALAEASAADPDLAAIEAAFRQERANASCK